MITAKSAQDKDKGSPSTPTSSAPPREGGKRAARSAHDATGGETRLTVVTVVRNGGRFLAQTVDSVLNQTFPGIEYVVIDGASTDGTLAIIESYDSDIDYWLSEPDSGIADAMNKGISRSRGEYILCLHADDYLSSNDAVEVALAKMKGKPEIAAFAIDYVSKGRHFTRVPRGFGPLLNFKTGLYHQAVLCRRGLFDELGAFDTTLSIAMDYEFWLRAYRHGVRPQLHDYPLSVMRDTGVSAQTDWPTLAKRFSEEKQAHTKHCRSAIDRMMYAIYWSLYLPYRYLRQLL